MQAVYIAVGNKILVKTVLQTWILIIQIRIIHNIFYVKYTKTVKAFFNYNTQ